MSSTTTEKTVSATEMDNEFISRGRPNEDFLNATSAMSENLKIGFSNNLAKVIIVPFQIYLIEIIIFWPPGDRVGSKKMSMYGCG